MQPFTDGLQLVLTDKLKDSAGLWHNDFGFEASSVRFALSAPANLLQTLP